MESRSRQTSASSGADDQNFTRRDSNRSLAGQQTFGIREYDEQLRELRRENFNLKLRIFFLEESQGRKPDGSIISVDRSRSVSRLSPDSPIRSEVGSPTFRDNGKTHFRPINRSPLQETDDVQTNTGKELQRAHEIIEKPGETIGLRWNDEKNQRRSPSVPERGFSSEPNRPMFSERDSRSQLEICENRVHQLSIENRSLQKELSVLKSSNQQSNQFEIERLKEQIKSAESSIVQLRLQNKTLQEQNSKLVSDHESYRHEPLLARIRFSYPLQDKNTSNVNVDRHGEENRQKDDLIKRLKGEIQKLEQRETTVRTSTTVIPTSPPRQTPVNDEQVQQLLRKIQEQNELIKEIQIECEELRRTEKSLRQQIDDLTRVVFPVPNRSGLPPRASRSTTPKFDASENNQDPKNVLLQVNLQLRNDAQNAVELNDGIQKIIEERNELANRLQKSENSLRQLENREDDLEKRFHQQSQVRIDSLVDENETLRQRLNDSIAKNRGLENELNENRQRFDQERDQLRQVQSEEIQKLRIEIEKLQKQSFRFSEQIEDQKRKLDEKDEELKRAMTLRKEEELREEIKYLNEVLKEAQRNSLKDKKDFEENFQAIQNKLQRAEITIQEMTEDKLIVQNQLDELHKRFDDYRRETDFDKQNAIERIHDEYANEIDGLKQRNAQLEQQNQALLAEKDRLREQIRKLQENESANEKLAQIKEEYERLLQEQKRKSEFDLTRYEEEIRRNQETEETLGRKLAEYKNELEKNQRAKAEINEILIRLRLEVFGQDVDQKEKDFSSDEIHTLLDELNQRWEDKLHEQNQIGERKKITQDEEIERLKNRMTEIEKQNVKLPLEIERYKEEVADKNEIIRQRQEILQNLQKQVENLSEQLKIQQDQNDVLRKQLEEKLIEIQRITTKVENEDFRERPSSRNGSRNSPSNYEHRLQISNDNLQEEIRARDKKILDLKQQLNEIEQQIEENDRHYQAEIRKLNNIINQKQHEIATAEIRRSPDTQKVEKLEKSLQKSRAEIAELKIQLATTERKREDLQEDIEQYVIQIKLLQSETERSDQKLDEFENIRQENSKLRLQIRVDSEQFRKRIEDLEEKLEMAKIELQRSNERVNSNENNHDDLIKDLKARLQKRDEELKLLQNSLEQTQDDLSRVRQSELASARKLQQMEENSVDKENQIEDFRHKLEAKNKRNRELENRVEKSAEDLERLENEIQQLNKKNRKEIIDKDQEVEQMRQELENLRQQRNETTRNSSHSNNSTLIIRPGRSNINETKTREDLLDELAAAEQEIAQLRRQLNAEPPRSTELHRRITDVSEKLEHQKKINQVLWRKLDVCMDVHVNGSRTRAELENELASYHEELVRLKSNRAPPSEQKQSTSETLHSRSSSDASLDKRDSGMSSAIETQDFQRSIKEREDEIQRLKNIIDNQKEQIQDLTDRLRSRAGSPSHNGNSTRFEPQIQEEDFIRLRQQLEMNELRIRDLENENKKLKQKREQLEDEIREKSNLLEKCKEKLEEIEPRMRASSMTGSNRNSNENNELSRFSDEMRALRQSLDRSFEKQSELQSKLDETIRQSRTPREFTFSGRGVSYPDLRLAEGSNVENLSFVSFNDDRRSKLVGFSSREFHSSPVDELERSAPLKRYVVGEIQDYEELFNLLRNIKFDLKNFLPELKERFRSAESSSLDQISVRSVEDRLQSLDERLNQSIALLESFWRTNLPERNRFDEHPSNDQRFIDENKKLQLAQRKSINENEILRRKVKEQSQHIEQLLGQVTKANRKKAENSDYLALLLRPTLDVIQKARCNIEHHLKESNSNAVPPGSAQSTRHHRRHQHRSPTNRQ